MAAEVLHIESLAYGGDSVSHLSDGRAVFISGGCPGDTVTFTVTEDKGRFLKAKIDQIVEASPDRVAPPCPYFGACGGCQWQHVAYETQAQAKRRAVVDVLQRIGKIDNAEELVAPTVQSTKTYGYRNKIELVTDPKAKRLSLGYHKAASSEVLPVDLCLLLPKRLQKAPKALTGALRYTSGDQPLDISRVGLRVGQHTSDIEIALWTPPSAFPRAQAARTLKDSLKPTSVVRVLQKETAKTREVSKVEVLAGKGHWKERLGEFEYLISAPSFFQTNTLLAEKLVELVLAALEPDGTDKAVDLYAGAGTFTLPLAELAGEVVAIESSGPAVRDLRRNLEANQLWAEAVGGDASREIIELGHFDIIVVDPPRAGLTEQVISALAQARPRAIAYVSCDPATLARDAKRLADVGFALTDATPVDLFPQTFHVETVARFEPSSKEAVTPRRRD